MTVNAGQSRFPTPPTKLTSRIGGRHEDYAQIGASHAQFIRDALRDWSWDDRHVLDFGCGTGRTLVQFADEAEQGEFWGCDIDTPSVEWARANLSPPYSFLANGEEPPLDLPSDHFDLVYGMSVFTHLTDTWSAWLCEMRRVLKVGGYGLFSFLGKGMIGEVAGHEWDDSRIGMIPLDIGKPWTIGGPNVLHSEWWLRAHWGREFEIVDIRPTAHGGDKGHGLILLRKDDRPAPTVEELERLEPGEPREIASLQYAIRLLGERTARLWSADTAALLAENDRLRDALAEPAAAAAPPRRFRLFGR